MNLELTYDYNSLDMSGYLSKIMAGLSVRGATTPAMQRFRPQYQTRPRRTEEIPLGRCVATILFVAKRLRMQCLAAVSVASRVNVATDEDREKLDRLFSYLATTSEVKFRLTVVSQWQHMSMRAGQLMMMVTVGPESLLLSLDAQ